MRTSDELAGRFSRRIGGILPFWMLFVLLIAPHSRAMTPEQQRTYREQLLRILPDVPSFNAWLKKTDELPPDFDVLPQINSLPDPLRFIDGRRVKNATDWQARREEILQLEQKWDIGSLPPKPKIDQVIAVDETRGKGYVTRNVKL